mgnify:CR=1 FL=1
MCILEPSVTEILFMCSHYSAGVPIDGSLPRCHDMVVLMSEIAFPPKVHMHHCIGSVSLLPLEGHYVVLLEADPMAKPSKCTKCNAPTLTAGHEVLSQPV